MQFVSKIMNSNNYVTPFYFTQPPPSYNVNNSWTYNWPSQSSQTVRSAQITKNSSAPPLPAGPPPLPPPPPPPPPVSRITTSHPSVNITNLDLKSPLYYNNSPIQGTYRARRHISSTQYSSTTGQYSLPSSQYASSYGQYTSSQGQYASSQGQYAPSQGQYAPSQGQFNSTSGQYNSNSSGIYNTPGSNYLRNYYGKRKVDSEIEKKSNKKKKKPLSQNVPQRKDWSVVDAKEALTIEKEYNKRHKSQSLIIKFPDLELNREIVSQFHSAIDSVHFQQPSTPRFCFVTLKDSAEPEAIMKDLNKIPFGYGHLTAEFKRDREDEITIGPEDIDPLTLYVGNLAQEVTKDDMVNTFPKQRRIDIGYAKKMKYTRYAFVSFKNVKDSVAAFKKTHATQMYSKSLIVRFRRLNGTVGMPGEPKPQMPQKNDTSENCNTPHMDSTTDLTGTDPNDTDSHNRSSDVETESYTNSTITPWEMVDVSQWETDENRSIDSISVKHEPIEYWDEDEEDRKPAGAGQYTTSFVSGDPELAFSLHKPKNHAEITEIKKETNHEENSLPSSIGNKSDLTAVLSKETKTAVCNASDATERSSDCVPQKIVNDNHNNSDCYVISPEGIKKETDKTSYGNIYDVLRMQHSIPLTKASISMEVKKEPYAVVEELSDRNMPGDNVAGRLRIKSEPNDKEDEINDGDMDDSSSSSDDFNFNNVLGSIEARTKRLKKLKKSN